MKKAIIASLLAIAYSPSIFAAEQLDLNDVVVTATRTPQPRESVIADVTVLDQKEIQRAGQASLAELLQQQPGFEMSTNGGPGKAANLFLRGTTAKHTLILIDGMRVQSATLGTTTIENLPLAQIDRIEILRGPATSLYGQDAIGGVVQIFTKKGTEDLHAYANLGFGTYNTKKGAAGVNGKKGDTRFALNVSAEDTDGFSAYDTAQANLVDDDGYRNLSVSGNLSHEITKGHTVGLQLLNSNGDTTFDNRFNATDFDSRSEIEQQAFAIYTNNQITSDWLSKIKLGVTKDKLESFDEFNPTGSRFDTKQTQLNWQNDIALPLGTLTLMYDRLEEEVTSTTQYNQTKRENNGYVASYLANINAHSLHVSLRRDNNSSFGDNTTGGLGYGYHLNDNWQVTTSYGTALKAPTFNDLYFPDSFGFTTSNPNLVPEKSKNIEASLRYDAENTQASVTLYHNKVRNLIALDQNFIPFNANEATLKGATIIAKHQLGHWQFGGSVDIQSPRIDDTNNLLVRRANRIAKAQVAYQTSAWRVGADLVSTSRRYNDANNQQPLAGYTLVNLTSEYHFNNTWALQARLNNVFDKDYALAFDGNPTTPFGFVYNTPGSNLFVNVMWKM